MQIIFCYVHFKILIALILTALGDCPVCHSLSTALFSHSIKIAYLVLDSLILAINIYFFIAESYNHVNSSLHPVLYSNLIFFTLQEKNREIAVISFITQTKQTYLQHK